MCANDNSAKSAQESLGNRVEPPAAAGLGIKVIFGHFYLITKSCHPERSEGSLAYARFCADRFAPARFLATLGMTQYDMKNDKNNLDILRHSTAHILAAAILEMFPEAKFAIGPNIDNGFYYDFDLPRTLIPEDLPLLEEKMRSIIKANYPFEKSTIDAEKAVKLFEEAKQNYKTELINDLVKDENAKEVTLYK